MPRVRPKSANICTKNDLRSSAGHVLIDPGTCPGSNFAVPLPLHTTRNTRASMSASEPVTVSSPVPRYLRRQPPLVAAKFSSPTCSRSYLRFASTRHPSGTNGMRPPAPSTAQRSTGQCSSSPRRPQTGTFMPRTWRVSSLSCGAEPSPSTTVRSVLRRRSACLWRVPSESVGAAACKGTAGLHRAPKAFLSNLSGHLPLSASRRCPSVRTSYPRPRRAADGGAIMGPQVSEPEACVVGFPPFPPFPDIPFPREMPFFCLSDPGMSIRHKLTSRVRTYQDRTWSWM